MPKEKIEFENYDFATQRFILAVARVTEVNGRELFTRFTRDYDFAKRVCYLAYRKKGLSYPAIGNRLHRDHTTIILGVKKIINDPKGNALADEILKIESTSKPIFELKNSIKEKLNNQESLEKIATDLMVSVEFANEIKNELDLYCEKKKIPNYKNCTIMEIYC